MVIGQFSRTRDGVENVKLGIQGCIAPNARFAFALQAKEISFWNFIMDCEYIELTSKPTYYFHIFR